MVLKSFWKLNIYVWAKTGALILLLCFCNSVLAAALDLYSFSSEQDKQRFLNLTQELRCVVCQSQSLADSDAVLAKDLRDKIYALINEKKSDEEIKQFLVSRYGEFILFSPPLSLATLLLWGFPLILLTAFGLGVYLLRA